MKLPMIIKILKIKLLILLFSIFLSSNIFSYPFTTRPDDRCDTSGQYDSDTKATVYGDSRMDYMGGVPGFPLYDLDVYLQYPSARAWNVQNFGLNGESSSGLHGHLEGCLKNASATGNYKIHENVAFHIGGNDFVNNIGVLFLYPWKQKEYVNYARYNNERIVVMLLKKRRNVLLTGHYPALSISKDPFFNTVDLGPNNKAVLDNITKAYTNPNYAINSSLINSKVNRCSGKEALQLSVDADVFAPIDPVSWYLGVQQGEFIGTIPSLGLMNLEPRIADIVERRKSQFTAIGKTLTHFPIWNCFRYSASPDAWVVDPNIMVDVIHPNVNGFGLWGKLVGNKFNQLGFPTSNFSIANQSIPAPPVVEDPEPVAPPPPPSNEDIAKAIALCFYFKICK